MKREKESEKSKSLCAIIEYLRFFSAVILSYCCRMMEVLRSVTSTILFLILTDFLVTGPLISVRSLSSMIWSTIVRNFFCLIVI